MRSGDEVVNVGTERVVMPRCHKCKGREMEEKKGWTERNEGNWYNEAEMGGVSA